MNIIEDRVEEEDMNINNSNIKKKRTRNNSSELKKKNKDTAENEIANSDDEGVKSKTNNKIHKKYINKSKNEDFQYRLIEPFRSIGLVIDNNKVFYYKRGNDRFILASNYNSFLLYNLEKLRLERISPPLPYNITSLAMYKNKVFTSVQNKVLLWDKIHIVKDYICPFGEEEYVIKSLMIFDTLLMVHNSNGDIYIFDINSGKLIKTLTQSVDKFIHPATYLNKILYSKRRERYEEDLNIYSTKIYLYNINTEKQIFEYDFNIKDGYICSIEQSPVIDVVAVGFSTGDIVLFNLKTLKKLMNFKAESIVENISFSNCVELGLSLLATSNTNGSINLWDLNKNALHYTIPSPHTKISSLFFLPNEPILLSTSGNDNSFKMFKLEYNTGTPSLLKYRSGHAKNPHKIRFYGDSVNNESNHILSISENDFRNLSMINEHMSKELSYKNLPKEVRHEYMNSLHRNKLETFDFNEFRERDWSNVLTTISNCPYPLLLSYENSTVSESLVKINTRNSNCTAVCVSMCGNFGFAGFENGNLEKFNMQSGLNKWTIEKGHKAKIITVKSDGINSLLVSISSDNTLKFWDIFQSTIVHSIELANTPDLLELNRDNDLIAVSLTNSDIHVYDKSTFKLVRVFTNTKKAKVNDMVFTNDGKWLILVSDDKTLKIYDILSGNLIEWVEFKQVPVSVTVSPNNQYIAISYSGYKGVYIWINRSLYLDFVDVEAVKEPLKIMLPYSNLIRRIKSRKEITEEENRLKEEMNVNKDKKVAKDKMDVVIEDNTNLIQFSKENKLKFRILNNLEKIQERSEPQVKKKEKAKAPFFLFNMSDILGGANKPKSTDPDTSPEFLNILKNYTHFKNEKLVKNKDAQKDLILIDILENYNQKQIRSYEITIFLNSLNPYLVDLEIRNLDPILCAKNSYILYFLNYLHEEVLSKSNFELIQAYLNRFLKVYSIYNIDLL